mmetsp:Transcript_16774/g.30403  ORF Transcript_16774/g.30403 Transcript_16774/m.30403 type:complete len:141 (-) Transcript_16774:189-611(-)
MVRFAVEGVKRIRGEGVAICEGDAFPFRDSDSGSRPLSCPLPPPPRPAAGSSRGGVTKALFANTRAPSNDMVRHFAKTPLPLPLPLVSLRHAPLHQRIYHQRIHHQRIHYQRIRHPIPLPSFPSPRICPQKRGVNEPTSH